MLLWLKNGKRREIEFQPNKVNLITGGSHTGKSAILDIIDYCFFASKSRISESMINENIEWYGLNLCINDKTFTIGRKSIKNGKVSNEYYFSSFGEIPDFVESNNVEESIKSIFETEFKIDSSAKFAYGSNNIKAGSKISLRYFLMFNTISGTIIENEEGTFFDKQSDTRYKEALPRIFDLALGIETIENILKSEKKSELEKQLTKLQKKNNVLITKEDEFKAERIELLKKAKEYSIIPLDTKPDEIVDELNKVIGEVQTNLISKTEIEKLESSFYTIQRKIKNLKQFSSEYNNYKASIKNLNDSLKPISFLQDKDKDIIKTSIFYDLLSSYETSLKKISLAYQNNTPIDKQVNDNVKILEEKLEGIKEKLSEFPRENKSFENSRDKYFFLGQVKSKLEIFASDSTSMRYNYAEDISALERDIQDLTIVNTEEKRDLTIKLIEEIISEYIKDSEEALANYSNYQPVFDYKNKALLLRKPKSSFIENVGSSSNHMFLHLFFSLAMHEAIFQNHSPFVPSFLVIDQPSRPYYGANGDRKTEDPLTDDYKIKKAFELLHNFIVNRNSNNGNFQMIVLEHIPYQDVSALENVHLVEEFTNGNALIPKSYLE